MGIFVGYVAGQPVDLALQAFNALQVRDVPCRQGADDLENAAVLLTEVVMTQRVQTDHGDDLVIANHRDGNLAFQQIAHGAVEAAGLLFLLDPCNYFGCLVAAT